MKIVKIPIEILMNKKIFSILKLYRTPHIGPVSFFYLINKFGSAQKAIENIGNIEEQWNRKIPKNFQLISDELVEREIEETLKAKGSFLYFEDDLFPRNFVENLITPIIITKGNINLLQKNIISVIGTRMPSLNGIKFCSNICETLGRLNFVIASGLAKGVDITAHKSSMKTGTIGIIAGGINSIYPKENEKYYKEIIEKGLLITEQSIFLEPSSILFPRRNALIASLGTATVIIESMRDSGALITAEKAKKYKKPIFAVPGHPYDERYWGNNYLLKNGAHFLTETQDILEILGDLHENNLEINNDFENFSSREQKIILRVVENLIGISPASFDEILYEARTEIPNLSNSKLLSVLIEMEILSLIKINENNTVYRIH